MRLLLVVCQRRPKGSRFAFRNCKFNTTSRIFDNYFIRIDFLEEIQCDFVLLCFIYRAAFEVQWLFCESVNRNWIDSLRIWFWRWSTWEPASDHHLLVFYIFAFSGYGYEQDISSLGPFDWRWNNSGNFYSMKISVFDSIWRWSIAFDGDLMVWQWRLMLNEELLCKL